MDNKDINLSSQFLLNDVQQQVGLFWFIYWETLSAQRNTQKMLIRDLVSLLKYLYSYFLFPLICLWRQIDKAKTWRERETLEVMMGITTISIQTDALLWIVSMANGSHPHICFRLNLPFEWRVCFYIFFRLPISPNISFICFIISFLYLCHIILVSFPPKT